MTDRELMQQALDALDLHAKQYPHMVKGYTADAAEAIRARLAQPEPEPVAWMYDWYDETEDIDGVPIGGIVHDWISKDYDEAHSPTMGCHNIRPLYTAPPQREEGCAECGKQSSEGWALYCVKCSEPVREWQGLTDEEITSLVREAARGSAINRDGSTSQRIARAIEAKLKEKNA